MRRRSLLPVFGGFFLIAGAAQVAGMVELPARAEAPAAAGLLAGCTDIPEAVELAEILDLRARRIDRFKAELERRRADIATAESTLTAKLRQLKALRDASGGPGAVRQAVRDDIDRVVAVYDQMKPAEAAAILTNLPPDFAAEILMRVEPEAGARIIAAVDPGQAAILTTHMSARSVAPAKD